jgi:hypothetical protein
VRRPSTLRDILDASAAAAVKVGVSLAVLATGFRAISDDDYARLVIAQRFAESPAVDPSGTSWLPLPFWLYGGAFAVFGDGLGVARAVALFLGALAAALVVLAARLLGLPRGAALAAGILSAIFPYSAYLGAAVVPEAVASALVVLGAASLARSDAVRLIGALGLGAACASRYEPWAAALAFGAVTAVEAVMRRDRLLAASALVAVSFPLAWVLHGVFRHDDALFFVSRVAKYRAALGPDDPFFTRLLRTPSALFVSEPELVFGTLALGAFAWRASKADPHFKVMLRASLCLLALFAALVLGDALGGAPTHHGERALLAVWLWCAVLAAWFGWQLVAARKFAALGAAAAVSLAAFALIRPRFPRDGFADRSAEVDIGRRARSHAKGLLVVDTPDYGYFAIQASFGSPDRIRVLDDHDPRKPRAPDVLADPAAPYRLGSEGARSLIVPLTRVSAAEPFATVLERNERFALLALKTNTSDARSPD